MSGRFLAQLPAGNANGRAENQKRNIRKPRESGECHQHPPRKNQRLGVTKYLTADIGAEPFFRTRPGYDQAARDGNHKRGNHRYQPVSDRENGVGGKSPDQIHAVLQHSNQESCNDVYRRDKNTRHRIALRKPAGPVHGAIEFGLRG